MQEAIASDAVWADMCRDPEFPCQHCEGVRSPRRCADKTCERWRRWVMLEWVRMQYRAGIFSKAELERRVDRINAEADRAD